MEDLGIYQDKRDALKDKYLNTNSETSQTDCIGTGGVDHLAMISWDLRPKAKAKAKAKPKAKPKAKAKAKVKAKAKAKAKANTKIPSSAGHIFRTAGHNLAEI